MNSQHLSSHQATNRRLTNMRRAAVLVSTLSFAVASAAAADLRLQVIPLSNTDGNRDGKHGTDITAEDFSALVRKVNANYAGTNIRFFFDPQKDWMPMADDILNNEADWVTPNKNRLAAAFPNKVVCFLRWGGDPKNATGNGHSWPPPGTAPRNPVLDEKGNPVFGEKELNYVALPNQSGGLNKGDGSFIAHELGHYLGLDHTFPSVTDMGLDTDQKIVDYIQNHGKTESAFDGDLMSDTPPDPGWEIYQKLYGDKGHCPENDSGISVTGWVTSGPISMQKTFTFSPSPNGENVKANVMSYFKNENCGVPPPAKHFSAQQIQRMWDVLTFSLRRSLLSGSSPEGPTAVTTPNGNIHVFARGDNRRIFHAAYSNGIWSSWQIDAGDGVFTSGPAAAATPTGELHVFGVGTDGNIWHSYWNGGVWTGWRTDLGAGSFTSAPSAVITVSGQVHVFARGNDNNIWHNVWSGSAWSGWKLDMGLGIFTSAPAATVTADGHIHVFARGTDRNIWHNLLSRTTLSGTTWSGWKSDLGAGGTLNSGPAVTVTPDRLIHVFARGDDRNMWHSYWNGSSWSGWNANLAQGPFSFMSGTTVVSTSSGNMEAFALGEDRNIWHSVWNGAVWSTWMADLKAKTFLP